MSGKLFTQSKWDASFARRCFNIIISSEKIVFLTRLQFDFIFIFLSFRSIVYYRLIVADCWKRSIE